MASNSSAADDSGLSTATRSNRPGSPSERSKSTLEVTLLKADQLTGEEIAAWTQIRANNPALDNPFFDVAYVTTFGSFNTEVEVAVMRRGGEIVGFFPFERDSANRGWPVGRRIADFQGVICAQDLDFDATELVKKCQLRSWRFSNLVTTPPFERSCREIVESGYIDLSDGMAVYEQGRKEAGSSMLGQIRRKARKIEREIGPLNFEWRSNDQRAFEKMLEWKAAQRTRTRTADPLKSEQVVAFLEHLMQVPGPDFSGLMSVLYVGDEVAAVHLGIHNASVLNICFPTYNLEFSKYSPGMILFLRLMEGCIEQEIHRIDLGAGPERYKSSMMTGAHSLGHGIVSVGVGSVAVHSSWYWLRKMSRHSLLAPHVQRLKHTFRGFRE
mgnify:CR=1 FL=1